MNKNLAHGDLNDVHSVLRSFSEQVTTGTTVTESEHLPNIQRPKKGRTSRGSRYFTNSNKYPLANEVGHYSFHIQFEADGETKKNRRRRRKPKSNGKDESPCSSSVSFSNDPILKNNEKATTVAANEESGYSTKKVRIRSRKAPRLFKNSLESHNSLVAHSETDKCHPMSQINKEDTSCSSSGSSQNKQLSSSSIKVNDPICTSSISCEILSPTDLIEFKYNFTIKPVTDYRNSQFIRCRNTRYKYVNLKSFINENIKKVIFKTQDIALPTLSQTFNKLNLKNSPSKAMRRKYPVEEFIGTKKQGSQKVKKPKKVKVRKEKKQSTSENEDFPDFYTEEQVVNGLAKGELVKGAIRINPKNSKCAYVNNEDTSLSDYYITSIADRNRALEGDIVVLKVKPESEWMDGQKTATVVYIEQKVHTRIMVGALQPFACHKKDSTYALFQPRDKRNPILKIAKVNWPEGFHKNPTKFKDFLYVAKMIEWERPTRATGFLMEKVGVSGDLEVETLSILKEHSLDTTPFPDYAKKCLENYLVIPDKEVNKRMDLRKQCIFTIDPATARDLDDALSVKELPNGRYEIGVHISDVSHFLEEGTELDQLVCQKATTIYLVNNVYHMLPVELCLHCSLLPGKDKLAFSVFWEMDEEGNIFSTKFSKTVVNSCAQLSYENAQWIIENPESETENELFPTISNGFAFKDISKTVQVLQKIAVNLRKKRIENGALRIDQVKLLFMVDPISGDPSGFRIYENKEAHRLIEEFMLLANISVAEEINKKYQSLALLRRHEPPKTTMLSALQTTLAACGVHVDISSSSGIHQALQKYSGDDFAGRCRSMVLNHLLSKPMVRARYFCSGTIKSLEDASHYALSVPLYTHFTSPIRRYADIVVHRLLASALLYRAAPTFDTLHVAAVAERCNDKKWAAKRASEASDALYLARLISANADRFAGVCFVGVVMETRERSFDVIVMRTGTVIRMYPNNCQDDPKWQIDRPVPSGPTRLTLTYQKTDKAPEQKQIIEIFTAVKLSLACQTHYKLEATLLRPTNNEPVIDDEDSILGPCL